MTPELRKHPDAQTAADACAMYILSLLGAAVAEKGTASLAISGGSTPKLMFDRMARAGFDWTDVHVFWVDERSVPPDHEQSNFRMANEHLIVPANISNVHRIPAELPPDHAASRYASDIRSHFQLGSTELPRFDVIHLGVGPDTHTASLFPGEPMIEDHDGLAAAVYVEKIPQWRITLLPGVLLAAKQLVVLAAGGDKREPLDHILNGPYSPVEYPAQIVTRHTTKPVFFIDAAAVA